MLYGVGVAGDVSRTDWYGAALWRDDLLEVPAKDECACRERVRRLTERSLHVSLEPLFVRALSRRFRFRRELPTCFNHFAKACVVSAEWDHDEARAQIWEALDGGAIRVGAVEGPHGFCVVEVGVRARCAEQAEVMMKDRLTTACLEHEMECVPLPGSEVAVWVEKRNILGLTNRLG